MATTSVRQRAREKASGAKWFDSLSKIQKFELGDAFVLGGFYWPDWFERKPSADFLRGADEARMLWECVDD